MARDPVRLSGRALRWVISGAVLITPIPAFAQEMPPTDAQSQVERLRALAAMEVEAGPALSALKLIPLKWKPGEPSRGIEMLRTLSDQGNVMAMITLSAFLSGTAESNQLLLRVTTSTTPGIWRGFAAFNLGVNYRYGLGVVKDGDAAIKWFRTAAEAGDERGMTLLGAAYFEGDHVAKDKTEAVRWFKLAAEKGEPGSMGLLGFMYQSGEGVTKDSIKALELLEAAAKKGSARAAFGAGVMLLSANPPDPTKALPFVQMAAEKHDPKAMGLLGSLYYRGMAGMPKDLNQAAIWSRKAAQANEPPAMMTMVGIFAESSGAIVTQEEGLKWLESAAALEDVVALRILGQSYENGSAPYAKDIDKALGYYRRAAALGDVQAREAVTRLDMSPAGAHAP